MSKSNYQWLIQQEEIGAWLNDHYAELLGVAIARRAPSPEDAVQNACLRLFKDERFGTGRVGMWPQAAGAVRSEASNQQKALRKRRDAEQGFAYVASVALPNEGPNQIRYEEAPLTTNVLKRSSQTCWLSRNGWTARDDDRPFAKRWVGEQRAIFRFLLRRDRFGIEPAVAIP